MGFTTTVTIIAPATGQACQPITPVVTGVLWDTTNGLPVVGETVHLRYNGTALGSDVTGAAGDYSIPSFYILVPGPWTLTIEWLGDGVYDPCSNTSPITISICSGDEDLLVGFFVTHYRTPEQIDADADCWGAVLCIDPNGLRATHKGPIYYLLDSCMLRPGLTEKAGGFAATINDNKTSIDLNGDQKRIYDMTLFEADTVYIRDNDEFWLGVQEGPSSSDWVSGVGGRYWFMGGWISKRYYTYDKQTRIIANLEGKCYMDLWKENYFGTSDLPRNYDEAVDFLQVVVDVLHDMNEAQGSNWEFRSDLENFPGSALTADVAIGGTTITVADTTPFEPSGALPQDAFIWDSENYAGETVVITAIPSATQLTIAGPGIVNAVGYSVGENAWIVLYSELTGVPLLKPFNNNPMFSVMRDACERADHEWKITVYPTGTTPAARRVLEFYPRDSAPTAGNPYITYGGNIRQLPSIMAGDVTNLLTNALVTGRPSTFPEDITEWINTRAWPAMGPVNRNRYYSGISTPYPPNSYSQAFADATLVFDDELLAALNIQKDNDPIFSIYFSLFAETSEIAVATLNMDLRKWRRLKFRFKHATAESPTIILTVVNYLNLVGSTITILSCSNLSTAPTRVTYLVEGVDWDAETDNDTTAENIRVAIRDSGNVLATRAFAVVTVNALGASWLIYIDSTSIAADLTIDTSEVNIYRIKLHTYNSTYAGVTNLWNQAFYYDFGTGVKQSSTVFNDPVTSSHDVIRTRDWGEIDLLLPDINPDGTIGDGSLGDLTNDEYMHGWRPVFLTGVGHSPDTTADPTDIDFLGIYVQCQERGPGGLVTDAPGTYVKNLSGTNKTFVATLPLVGGALVGDRFLNVTNAYRMAGDYIPGTGPPPTEDRIFTFPYPKYVIWKAFDQWEEIEIREIAGVGGLFPGGHNVALVNPLEQAYAAPVEILCRGGWNISFSQLHFIMGSIDKETSLPANLADPKRFRLLSSDDVEYLVDVEGLADQALLDSAAYQAIKVTLDGDPRHQIGLRMVPMLDPNRSAAGLPTSFHDIYMVVDVAEYHIVASDFFSVLLLGTLATRGKERILSSLSGESETKLARTSYGARGTGFYQRK